MIKDLKARVFKIERLNSHNGPGLRTVLFFKGCPLHCTWCHNPEGINARKQIWFTAAKCIGCGSCVQICTEQALELTHQGIVVDRHKCTGCYKCVDECPSKALSKIGEDVSVDELMDIILKDKIYFLNSGGGVTVTGGEPGIYADFIAELFIKCRQNGIQTAFDTSGAISLNKLEHVLRQTDLLFLDLKIIDKEKSETFTGLKTAEVINSLNWLKGFLLSNPGSLKLSIRTPLIPQLTDTDENLLAIAQLIKEFGEDLIDSWELCAFNDLCEDKYNKLDYHWAFKDSTCQKKSIDIYTSIIAQFSKLKVEISGLTDTAQ